MTPIRTVATNSELTARGCLPLPVSRAGGVTYSYWRATWRERWLIFLGRPVRLAILGKGMPPVALNASPAAESREPKP